MKKITLFLSLLLMFSCQQEDAEMPEKTIPESRVTKSSAVLDVIEQLAEKQVPFYIVDPRNHYYMSYGIGGGLSQLKLSTKKVSWVVEKTEEAYQYNIRDYSKPNKYWTLGHEIRIGGNKMPYSFTHISNNLYYIKNEKTSEILGCKGKEYAKLHPFDKSLYMEWMIELVDGYELIDISYVIEAGDITTQAPSFIQNTSVKNNTSVTQTMTTGFSQRASITSSFSRNLAVAIQVSAKGKAGIPLITEGELSTTTTTTNTWTWGETETKEDTRTYNFPVNVPPYSTVRAKAMVRMYKANATYIARFRSLNPDVKHDIYLKGKWNGILAGEINYELTEEKTGKILKTFTGVPTNVVNLK